MATAETRTPPGFRHFSDRFENICPDQVQDEVDRRHGLLEPLTRHIDEPIRTKLHDQILRPTVAGPDHACSGHMSQLDGKGPNASRGSVDQHGLLVPELTVVK